MKKFERIPLVLWLILALLFVENFPLVQAVAKAEPLAAESSKYRPFLDIFSSDPVFDSLFLRVSVPAGTGTQSVHGLSGLYHLTFGIARVIPYATGPPRLET